MVVLATAESGGRHRNDPPLKDFPMSSQDAKDYTPLDGALPGSPQARGMPLIVKTLPMSSDGSPQNALPAGRAAAAASVPTVLSTEDKTALDAVVTSTGKVAAPVTPVATGAVTASQIAKASAGTLFGLNVVSGAAAGYVMLLDAATVPVDGAVAPKKCFVLPATSSLQLSWDKGLTFATGIVVIFSTTGPYTKTSSTTAFIETEVL